LISPSAAGTAPVAAVEEVPAAAGSRHGEVQIGIVEPPKNDENSQKTNKSKDIH